MNNSSFSKTNFIDCAFARFNTIITSLKALDEGYSSKNYEPQIHEMIIKKDSEIFKAKVERKSIALKAKKESNEEECSTSGSEDEEYAMAVRDFKKFFKRRGRFVRQPRNDKKTFQRSRDDKNGSWSDSGEEDDEKVKDETCLVAHASSEVCSESSYFSDENSSIDDLALDNEYDKLCKMSLKIITKNKRGTPTHDGSEGYACPGWNEGIRLSHICVVHSGKGERVVEESEKEVDSDLLSDARSRPGASESGDSCESKEVHFLGHVVNNNGIHVDPSKIEAVKNWKASKIPLGIWSFMGLAGKANVVADALSRKERVKPKRVRALSMTIQSGIKEKLLAA
ncbi:hypothetical protein Tco_1326990 [Tanacetum coccineum]